MKSLDKITQKELLDTRLCDLNLKIEGTQVYTCLKRVLKEIDKKGIKINPHFWISDEWFSPDGIPGVAVPFYLLHPKLMKLEKKMMGEIEGGTKVSCTKIIRHEMGHVLDNAFKLRVFKKGSTILDFLQTPTLITIIQKKTLPNSFIIWRIGMHKHIPMRIGQRVLLFG